jgi:hypothetical protein
MIRFPILLFLLLGNVVSQAVEPATIGSRRELFVDDWLVERFSGKAELRLHRPSPQNVVFVTDSPWEGNGTNSVTVFRDGPKYRMYYRGSHCSYLGGKDRPSTRDLYCYAESPDGIHWTKPGLGLFAWNGSKQNNIVWDGVGSHAFVPFRDANPKCAADARYKALGVGGAKHGLYAFKSADGIHWVLMRPEPVVTKGAFDSQNLAFWDADLYNFRFEQRQPKEEDNHAQTQHHSRHDTAGAWVSLGDGRRFLCGA